MFRTAFRLSSRVTKLPACASAYRRVCSAGIQSIPSRGLVVGLPNSNFRCIQALSRSFSTSQPPPEPVKQIVEARGRELVLSPPALVVTREFEWGNIVLGFEQANRYTIRAAPGGEVVGYIAEEDSLGKSITRNLLRTHRSFRATVLDKHGDPAFIIRRPFYVVSTSMFVETPEGELIGEVHMNWHLYRRRYSMYINKTQFAHVDSGFLAIDFDMRDEDGRKLASVNKDFTGFAREIFTDARQYVLRLDPSMGISAEGLVRDVGAVAPTEDVATAGAKLTQDQRAVLLSTAIAIDFDYFSLHSRGHMGPGMMMPMPIPGGGGGAAGAGGLAGADVAAAAMMGEDDDGLGDEGLDLGGDSGFQDGGAQGSGFQDSGFQDPESDFQAPDDANQEWGTFEEADYGFQEDPSDDGTSDWGSGDGDDGEGGGGIWSVVNSVSEFFGDD